MNNIKWCCNNFKESTNYLDEDGVYIGLKKNPYNDLVFFMLFKSIADSNVEQFSSPEGIKVCLALSFAIRYCPWCGCKLASFYQRSIDDLLAKSSSLTQSQGSIAAECGDPIQQ